VAAPVLRRVGRTLVSVFVLLLVASLAYWAGTRTDPYEPPYFPGWWAYEVEEIPLPPSAFNRWWGEVEECSGAVGYFGDIEWLFGRIIFDETGFPLRGGHRWIDDYGRAAIIVDATMGVHQLRQTVKHEIIHHLVPNARHDSWLFQQCTT
jgi:hypothetical protein